MIRKKIRVAAYARVSSDKDDQLNSLENQKSFFADYIKSRVEWEFVGVYWDEGISGTQTIKRKGFNNMIADAMNKKIDLIITKEVTRFARNTVDTLWHARELKERGVGIIFILDNIDTRDADSEYRLTIMASNAQEESRKTSERVKWGQRRQMEKGVVFGRDLLGYTVKNGILHINPEEVPVVKAIFHKYTNEGKGTHVIARELLEEGMQPKRVKLWSNVVILRVLRNEKYVGDLCQKKTITPNYLTHKKKYNRGEEDMIYLKDHHEPIISRDLWNRTQEELKRRSKMTKEQKMKYSNRHWCSGKIRCAECGSSFVRRTKKLKNGTRYKAWRCHEIAQYGAKKKKLNGKIVGCNNLSVNEKSLVACMNYCILFLRDEKESLQKEMLQEIEKINIKKNERKYDEKIIKEKIKKYELKKKNVVDLMLDGIISKKDLKEQIEWYDKKISALTQNLMDIDNQCQDNSKNAFIMQEYIEALDEIMDIEKPSEMVYKEILDHIDVHKEHIIDIWLKGVPFGISLKIETKGRAETYKTIVLETKIIEKQEEQ